MTLDEAYERVRTQWSDIQLCIPAIEEAVLDTEARTVIELGTRTGISTVVFLHALTRVCSVDTEWPTGPFVGVLSALSVSGAWRFIHGSDLDPDVTAQLPRGADLAFIDTTHGYEQTLNELYVYRQRVREGGRILLHDVKLKRPETAPPDDPDFPVWEAMDDFGKQYDIAEWDDEQYAGWTNGCKNSLGTVYC